MSLFEEFNREYAKYFESDFPSHEPPLAAELKAGALVEISVVAYKD